jgi:DNA replication protein DnaC
MEKYKVLKEQLRILGLDSISSYIDKLSRQSLLIIDKFGYTPLSPEDANLFFQLVSRKYEKTSIVISSNKNFRDWGGIFNDDVKLEPSLTGYFTMHIFL